MTNTTLDLLENIIVNARAEIVRIQSEEEQASPAARQLGKDQIAQLEACIVLNLRWMSAWAQWPAAR